MKFYQFEMLFDNRFISFNSNVIKEEFKTNEQLLSWKYNLFSSDFENEENAINQNEGIKTINLFNSNFNISESLDDSSSKAYFIDEINNLNYENPQEKELIKTNQKKEIKKLRKKRKLNREIKEIAIKRHTASDDDNILRKIQVQYISFIIHCSKRRGL